MSKTVLVTDGDQRASLAVVRSLGKAGYRVLVAAPRRSSLATVSRYCAAGFVVPSTDFPDEYAAALIKLVVREQPTIVIPLTEAAIQSLLSVRERLSSTLLPFPSLDRFSAISDKRRLLDTARSLGINVPEQVVLSSPEEIQDLSGENLALPAVLKPHRSVGQSAGSLVKFSVRYANDLETARRLAAELPRSAYPILVQRRVVGPGLGVFLLRWDERIRASFMHRRVREKPPSGGVSVSAEGIARNPSLLAQAESLLEAFEWQGVAMVEFKEDQATGANYLMEVNARFWGSLQLAIDSGVDFPLLLVHALCGEPANGPAEWRAGVRTQWFWGEIDHLLARFRERHNRLSGAPGLWATSRDVLRDLLDPRVRNEVLRLRDPRPFFQETLDWLRGR